MEEEGQIEATNATTRNQDPWLAKLFELLRGEFGLWQALRVGSNLDVRKVYSWPGRDTNLRTSFEVDIILVSEGEGGEVNENEKEMRIERIDQ